MVQGHKVIGKRFGPRLENRDGTSQDTNGNPTLEPRKIGRIELKMEKW